MHSALLRRSLHSAMKESDYFITSRSFFLTALKWYSIVSVANKVSTPWS